jgi:hypothetical protein
MCLKSNTNFFSLINKVWLLQQIQLRRSSSNYGEPKYREVTNFLTCLVSNWNMCRTPATLILKNTAVLLLPNCIMSLNSAECKYSFGTGRKKCTCGPINKKN